MRRFAGLVVLVVVITVVPSVTAQTSGAASMSRPTPPALGFFTSYRFSLEAMRAVNGGDAFVWDAEVGADLDVFDFGFARGNVLTLFESIVGNEFRPIDPNLINYTIDLSVFWRPGEGLGELGPVLHHVSRHRSDRSKEAAIAWNLLGLQYVNAKRFGIWDVDMGARGLWKLQRSFVDYAGEFGGYAGITRPLHRWVSIIARGEATAIPVVHSLRNRSTQFGSKVELGLRFNGLRGVGEVFVVRERRIDTDPLDLFPRTFTLLGFRFLSH